jgi:hypothetical protein
MMRLRLTLSHVRGGFHDRVPISLGMKPKNASKFRSKHAGQKTISDLKRKDGYGEYRLFLEDIFEEMKEENLIRAEMYKRLVDRFGFRPMSRSHFYRFCADVAENPKTAFRDLRSVNSGRKRTKLTEQQEYALSMTLAHFRLFGSGFPDALEDMAEFAPEFALAKTDLPPLWRCYDAWDRLTPIQKLALENNFKDVFKKLGCWTENPKCFPDDEHNFDEGKHSIKFQVQDGVNKRVRITVSLHVDRSTWVIRMPHFSYKEFNERESILALKKALSAAPEIGLEHGCIPKQVRCDHATYHLGFSFQFADDWLRNRSGRNGRIVYTPVQQPLANPSAERAIGEMKRKFLRKFLKAFLIFLEQDKVFKRPTLPGAVAHLEDIEWLLIAFIKKHNNRTPKGTAIPRIQKYREGAPSESTSVTAEEIHKNVLYIRQLSLPQNGILLDGIRYDGDYCGRYRDRDDTYIGVLPEGNSPFAVLFVMDPQTKEMKRVLELEPAVDSHKVSPRKQKGFMEEFTTASSKNTDDSNHFKKMLARGMSRKRHEVRQEKARQEAAARERLDAAVAAAAAKAPMQDAPSETPAPATVTALPVRPQIEIRKAA